MTLVLDHPEITEIRRRITALEAEIAALKEQQLQEIPNVDATPRVITRTMTDGIRTKDGCA